jgi:hypothetical protein
MRISQKYNSLLRTKSAITERASADLLSAYTWRSSTDDETLLHTLIYQTQSYTKESIVCKYSTYLVTSWKLETGWSIFVTSFHWNMTLDILSFSREWLSTDNLTLYILTSNPCHHHKTTSPPHVRFDSHTYSDIALLFNSPTFTTSYDYCTYALTQRTTALYVNSWHIHKESSSAEDTYHRLRPKFFCK